MGAATPGGLARPSAPRCAVARACISDCVGWTLPVGAAPAPSFVDVTLTLTLPLTVRQRQTQTRTRKGCVSLRLTFRRPRLLQSERGALRESAAPRTVRQVRLQPSGLGAGAAFGACPLG